MTYTQPVDNLGAKHHLSVRHAHVIHMLDTYGTLLARASQRLTASPIGLARWVAIVIGITLSIAFASRVEASNLAYKESNAYSHLRAIADYQLTDKQYKCHNEIVFRESSNRVMAVNGSHYGFYQMRTTATKTNDAYKQFITYWYYVTHRYGVTQYDEPNYCKALKHLKSKGWQ